jgi:hypothetical protein
VVHGGCRQRRWQILWDASVGGQVGRWSPHAFHGKPDLVTKSQRLMRTRVRVRMRAFLGTFPLWGVGDLGAVGQA